MNCPRCNAEVVGDARFCGICGYALPALNSNPSQANPSLILPANDEATLIAQSWPGVPQPPHGPQEQPFYGQAPLGGAPTVGRVSPSVQPGAWPQQASQAGWSPANQSRAAYPPGAIPGTLNSSGSVSAPIKKRKRGGRAVRRLLWAVLLLLAIAAGGWFFGVRPYAHDLVQAQLDQALGSAESQMLLFDLALPPGSRTVPVDENSVNNYLSARDTNQLQNLHAVITPDNLRLDFSVYGFQCSIVTVPVASNGVLQVTNVQVQGVLGLVMSSDELTSALNSNFQSFSHQMQRTIGRIALKEHEMDVQIN